MNSRNVRQIFAPGSSDVDPSFDNVVHALEVFLCVDAY